MRIASSEVSVLGSSTNSNFKASQTASTYDAWGRRVLVTESTPGVSTVQTRTRAFAYDMAGEILRRTETGAATQRYAYANGQQVASGMSTDTASTPVDVLSRLTGYQSSEVGAYQTTVQAGESLRDIAQRVYGNGNLWYVLAEANSIANSELVQGMGLKVPEVKVTSNDAATFKPFNPDEAIGSTTPNLPYITPPPKHHCKTLVNVLSTVVSYIVGAIVSVYAGPYAGAAAQGAVKVHSQQVFQAMADGRYDWGRLLRNMTVPLSGNKYDIFDPLGAPVEGGIDYKAVAVGAASSLATYGAGQWASQFGSSAVQVAVEASTSYAANYQFSKWAGYDVSWSNRQFATNVGAALISEGIFRNSQANPLAGAPSSTVSQLPGRIFDWKEVATATMQNVVRSGVQYAVGKALDAPDAHWNTGNVLADAFGNALGNALAKRITAPRGESPKPLSAQTESQSEADWGAFTPNWPAGAVGDYSETGWRSTAFGQLSARPNAMAQGSAGALDLDAFMATPRYQSADGSNQWGDLPHLSRDTVITDLQTGITANTTPYVVVMPDARSSEDFFNLWQYARTYDLPAPAGATPIYLNDYRAVMDAHTRPAYNNYLAQNQAFYRSQGIGVDIGRGGVAVEGRNDWRDIQAMGRMIRGGLKGAINGIAALPQMAPGFSLYRMVTGEGMWQPFKMTDPAERAGEIAFGVAGLFVGGGEVSLLSQTSKAPRMYRLSDTVSDWSDLGIPLRSKGIADTAGIGSPTHLVSGQVAEVGQLAALNSTGKMPFTPTPDQVNSAAFKVIVGEPKYTRNGELVGTIFDGMNQSGLAEVKNGSSMLDSSYQLRLQTYGALANDVPLTIYTSRPVNPTFLDYLTRWGVSVKPLPH